MVACTVHFGDTLFAFIYLWKGLKQLFNIVLFVQKWIWTTLRVV